MKEGEKKEDREYRGGVERNGKEDEKRVGGSGRGTEEEEEKKRRMVE